MRRERAHPAGLEAAIVLALIAVVVLGLAVWALIAIGDPCDHPASGVTPQSCRQILPER